jgi:hypothetical protein
MKQVLAALALTLAAAPATAQNVGDCDGLGSAANIVEPWESYSRSFANGDVRLALLDAIEPGAVPFHLLLLAPSHEEMGGRICKVISLEPGIGFHNIFWDEVEARYDPAVGLIFHAPVEIWIDTGNTVMRGLQVTLNSSTHGLD